MKIIRPATDSARASLFAETYLKVTNNSIPTIHTFNAKLAQTIDIEKLTPLEKYLHQLATGNPTMLAIKDRIRVISPRTEPVLITGPTGTGKELIAKACHGHRYDTDQPFVAENCGAIPESLAPSIFFGYMKGAYTGAVADHPGKLVSAGEGTIFLDEIGAMSPYLQTMLLRAIQENEVYAVGATKATKVQCRFIAATSRDLRDMVENNKFLPDLYYRLNTFTIKIPPFSERVEDIDIIAKSLGYSNGIDPAYYPEVYKGGVRAIQTYISRMTTCGTWQE